jgi:hypothetical protein
MMRDVASFRKTAEAFLDESHTLFPHEASKLGLRGYDEVLGENNEAVFRKYTALLHSTLLSVEQIPDTDFGPDDWLDRRGFLSFLRDQIFKFEIVCRHRENPQLHVDAAIDSIFDLIARDTDQLPRVVPAILARLRKLPDFLGNGASLLRRPTPLWTNLAAKTCDGAILFLDDLELSLPVRPDDRASAATAFAAGRTAFANFARAASRKPSGSPQGFAIGRRSFEALIHERLGLAYSLPEAVAIGRRWMEKLEHELRIEAARFGRKHPREILEQAARDWTPARPLIEEYQRVTRTMRDRFAKKKLLTLPENEQLDVRPVPDFLRHQFPTAAYHMPPPFARNQRGIFWVNDLSLQQSTPAAKLREIRQHFGLELTCAHEAYPGHHVQFVVQHRHPSKLRRLFEHSIYYEGWTLWCEKMCVDNRLVDSPYAKLIQLADAHWRACRIVIDCGLHGGEMTYRQAAQFLEKHARFTRARAEADVNWYTAQPTVPMSYLLGRLEVEKLHRHLVIARGWSIRKFNDWLLSYGAVPWSWIWQASLRS